MLVLPIVNWINFEIMFILYSQNDSQYFRNTRVHTMDLTDHEKSAAKTKTAVQAKHRGDRYRQLLREFAENSSAGGVNKVFSSKTLLIRSTWIVLCIACYGAMVFLSYKLLQQYFGNPTATFVDVTFERVSNTRIISHYSHN